MPRSELESPRLRGPRRPDKPRWTFLLSATVCVLMGGAVLGQDKPIASDPVFKVQLLDGRSISGRISEIGNDGSVKLMPTDGVVQAFAPTLILKLTRESAQQNPGADGPLLIFPDGDSLQRVSILSATETALEISSNDLGKIRVPLESLLGVVFLPPVEQEASDSLSDRVRSEARTSEVIWMTNGDRRVGGFLGLTDRTVRFQIDAKPVEIDRTGVVALGFDPALVNYPRPKSVYFEVALVDGSRIGLTGCRLDRGKVIGATRFGSPIQISLSEVVGFYVRSTAVEFLSEREMAGVQYVPYVGPTRPFRVDRAVDGSKLSLSGQRYDRGLGTQSRTLMAYKLKPDDRRFQAAVGLDDRAGPLGNVAFRVLIDGKERFATPPMTVKDPARVIDLDLSGAKTLILITEFGERGDVRDHADWVDARILH